MKTIALWGATGSIGLNTVEIIRRNPQQFRLKYMSYHANWKEALNISENLKPEVVVVTDKSAYESFVKNCKSKDNLKIVYGADQLNQFSQDKEIDLFVNALVGEAGLVPTVRSLENGLNVALANKESLVMAGEVINRLIDKYGGKVFPIDSEHSAIWQCLNGEKTDTIKKIILTASGGPFRTYNARQLENVTIEDALNHPNWKMGRKITIDSATLMNKGLEFIEAYWLYPVNTDQIDIVIHPQSIIHSLVEFIDGSLKAQLGFPDMKIPIQYALTYPERILLKQKEFNLADIGQLTFEPVRDDLFPALSLARKALENGGVKPAVLNVANEYLVYAFLEQKIKFTGIVEKTITAVEKAPAVKQPSINDILDARDWAKTYISSELS